jgi:drug/metabolite transporter (DMT)-like permease
VFNTVIKLTSTIFASLVTYLIPVVALILGILDGETITVWSIVWVVFIIIGVMLANKKV